MPDPNKPWPVEVTFPKTPLEHLYGRPFLTHLANNEVIALVSGIVAGIAALSSVGSWVASRDSAEVAKRALEMANEPEIAIQGTSIYGEDAANGNVKVKLIFQNYGSGLASDVRVTNYEEIKGIRSEIPSTLPKTNTIAPHAALVLYAQHAGMREYGAIKTGSTIWILSVTLRYRGGPEKVYTWTGRYDHVDGDFKMIEAAAGPPP